MENIESTLSLFSHSHSGYDIFMNKSFAIAEGLHSAGGNKNVSLRASNVSAWTKFLNRLKRFKRIPENHLSIICMKVIL